MNSDQPKGKRVKLDRNINPNGMGKYALIKLRVDQPHNIELFPGDYQIAKEAVDFGGGEHGGFFVIRLKDKYAAPALAAYAMAAYRDDPEYAREILTLAKAAADHPDQTKPT